MSDNDCKYEKFSFLKNMCIGENVKASNTEFKDGDELNVVLELNLHYASLSDELFEIRTKRYLIRKLIDVLNRKIEYADLWI